MLSRLSSPVDADIDRIEQMVQPDALSRPGLATNDDEEVAARTAHRDRMKKLHEVIKNAPSVGSEPDGQRATRPGNAATGRVASPERRRPSNLVGGMMGMMQEQMRGMMGTMGTPKGRRDDGRDDDGRRDERLVRRDERCKAAVGIGGRSRLGTGAQRWLAARQHAGGAEGSQAEPGRAAAWPPGRSHGPDGRRWAAMARAWAAEWAAWPAEWVGNRRHGWLRWRHERMGGPGGHAPRHSRRALASVCHGTRDS